jgi:hypothetical protein
MWKRQMPPHHSNLTFSITSTSGSKEVIMNVTHHLRIIARFAAALAGLAVALVASGATPAFAVRVPPPGESASITALPPQAHTIVASGMAGWQIALIALAAALFAATMAVLLDRARMARKLHTTTV